jgi:hypothetical protein
LAILSLPYQISGAANSSSPGQGTLAGPPAGQTPLRGAGDQYLSLVTSRKLMSRMEGGGFRSGVMGIGRPARPQRFSPLSLTR